MLEGMHMAKQARFTDGMTALREAAGVTRSEPAPLKQGSKTPPSRVGRVAISGYYDPAVRKQFGILAIEQNRSQEAMLAKALNLLFEHYGKPAIAKES